MKKIYNLIFAALLLAAPALAQDAPANQSFRVAASTQDAACDALAAEYGYPSYYCDCDEQIKRNRIMSLPFDITISDTIWYMASSNVFLDGCTAFLYSETNIKLMIMQYCSSDSTSKFYREIEVNSNQARDVEASTIKELMEQNDASANLRLRLCIAPEVPGTECRFICAPYNQGPQSTCDDCLALLPEMVFVTSHANDVYEFDPTSFSNSKGVRVEWFKTDYPCMLQIKQGDCNGTIVASTTLMPDGAYELSSELLNEVRNTQEKLYFQFIHPTGTAGRFRLVEYDVTPSGPTAVVHTQNPAHKAQIFLGNDGQIYIFRDGQRYNLMGNKL